MTNNKEMKRKLKNLMDHVKIEFWDMRKDLINSWDIAEESSQILQRLKLGEYLNSLPLKSRTMAKMLTYLGLVESLGITFIDMVLMLLIHNGNEMHTRGPYVKHVTTLKEVQKLDLAYKQQFLKTFELTSFLKLVNRNLRNDIAHLNFKIQDDGTIKCYNGSLVNIDTVIQEFWETLEEIIETFDEIGFTNFLNQGRKENEQNP